MQPASFLLLFLGYALALPIALRIATVVREQQRVRLAGHQAGVIIVIIGWMLAGRFVVAVVHLVWIIGVRVWLRIAGAGDRTDSA